MAYSIFHKGTEGQTLTATIQRVTDGYFWDNVAGAWVSLETPQCLVGLSEGTTPGDYSVTIPALSPASGNVFRIKVYSGGVAQFYTEGLPYDPDQKTALQLINEVQKRLRLSQSASIIETHAQLILGFINDTALNIVAETAVWDALRFKGGFYTIPGVSIYPILLANALSGIDALRNLQIDISPIEKQSDREFRDFKRNYDTGDGGQPSIYRNYGRAGANLLVEVCPTPNAVYSVDFEGLLKVSALVAESDTSPLDQEALVLGAVMLSRDEGGEDAQGATTLFKMKLELINANEGESSWGDIEAV
jgi:hypothetical protein